MSDGKNAFGTFFIIALCLLVVGGAVIIIKKASENKQDSGLSLSKSGEEKIKATSKSDIVDAEYKVVKKEQTEELQGKSLAETKESFNKMTYDEHPEKIKHSEGING